MKSLRTHLATASRRLFLARSAEVWLRELDPTWSVSVVRARVVEVVCETADTKTFVLAPNGHWRGHRAGQFTTITVEIDGVRVSRSYSISSAPTDRYVAITVKRIAGGRVSGWLHDHLRAGSVIEMAAAAGDFVVPEHPPSQLLLLSGGSGITPVMSILRDLVARDAVRDLVFVHHNRSRADVAFRDELDDLAACHHGLRVVLRDGPLDEHELAREVPDFAERPTYLCGPPGLMDRVEAMWRRVGATLHRERFTAPPVVLPATADSELVQLRLSRADHTIAVTAGMPLLGQLERAGQRPPSGCRIGICHTCKTRKRSGVVQNLVDGSMSSAPDEDIQLCISAACSHVELDL